MVELSIIIPTLNEEKYLPKLLDSIKKQDYRNYEIIVSDGNSKDNTQKIAKEYGCKVVEGGLPGKARNNGAKIAKGKYLLFLDADVILPETFIKEVIEKFEWKGLDAITCKSIPLSNKKSDKIKYFFANNFLKIFENIKPMGVGYCILTKKEIFEKVKGFDESLKLCEDHDILNRISKVGKFKVLYKPKIYVSVRRFEKEGNILILKYIKVTIYYLLGKRIESENIIDYKFGHFNEE